MKKLLALVLAWMLMLSLAACGGTGLSTDKQTDGSQSYGSPVEKFLNEVTYDNATHKGVCGSDAVWYYKENILVISGTGTVSANSWIERVNGIGTFLEGVDPVIVVVSEGITHMPEHAFDVHRMSSNSYNHVSTVYLPSTLEDIPKCAFFSCDNLNSINIPDSVTSIGECAFGKCESLTSIDIPSSVIEIDWYAFDDCDSLSVINYSGPDDGYPWGAPLLED